MSKPVYKQLKSDKKGVEVVLEFPHKAENQTVIQEEVKNILSNLLQEQIGKDRPL